MTPERSPTPALDDLLAGLLRREGGFVDHPDDRGGPTKYGITRATLSSWLRRPASVDEVRNLDEATAREIYVSRYLSGPRIDTLPGPIVPLVFDCAVNHGPRTAVRFVQKVVNEAGFGPCDVDGVLGPDTRARAERAQEAMGGFLVNAIVEERLAFYEAIVARDPSQGVFLKGWRARAEEFRVAVDPAPGAGGEA